MNVHMLDSRDTMNVLRPFRAPRRETGRTCSPVPPPQVRQRLEPGASFFLRPLFEVFGAEVEGDFVFCIVGVATEVETQPHTVRGWLNGGVNPEDCMEKA